MDYVNYNEKIINDWADEGWIWSIPVTPEICEQARRGDWGIRLTPLKTVPKDWFPPLKGKKLLGLAAGGGQQMPILVLVGADCTVLDFSLKQIEAERLIAKRENYKINIIQGDMTKRLPFDDATFDIIVHPVSNVYAEDVNHIWRECFRVLKSGGILLSGLDNGIDYLFDNYDEPLTITNKLPFNPLKNPEQMAKLQEDDAIQFSHTFEEQIGGQLKAGFVMTGAYEDYHPRDAVAARGIPTYWATKAVKP